MRVIDLGNATVLPGFIDCHTRLTGQPDNYYEDIFRKWPIDVGTTSHLFARRTLLAGFTTVRNVGTDEYSDLALRRASTRAKSPDRACSVPPSRSARPTVTLTSPASRSISISSSSLHRGAGVILTVYRSIS